MTTGNPTPPAVGRNVSVRVLDEGVYDDLAVLMRPGGTASDAIRLAVRHLADAYRTAWDYDDVPDGTAPRILGVRYHRDGRPPITALTASDTSHPQVRG
ncbi:hypothetical protein [Streptomyces sp. NPDC026673]|uniref:hypothetical protein n=1 Tax=Streptomyces sp. NPDC026673 TaxID=3155724 RepID=UPI0033FD0FC5